MIFGFRLQKREMVELYHLIFHLLHLVCINLLFNPLNIKYISLGRDDGCNYIFNLLTGYQDQPAGLKGEPGLHYNPYFSGGWIAMAKQLYDDQIEYSDGTKATESQLAKDVTEFLKWTAERDHDDRKKLAIKALLIFAPLVVLSYHWKRVKWATLKSKKIAFYRPKPKDD